MGDLSQELGDGVSNTLVAAADVQGGVADLVSLPGQTGFWSAFSQKLSNAQSAVAEPVKSFARSAAKSVGASDGAASEVGSALLPVLLIAAAVGFIIYHFKFRSRKVTA